MTTVIKLLSSDAQLAQILREPGMQERFLARSTTQQFSAPIFEGGESGDVVLVFSGF